MACMGMISIFLLRALLEFRRNFEVIMATRKKELSGEFNIVVEVLSFFCEEENCVACALPICYLACIIISIRVAFTQRTGKNIKKLRGKV